MKPIRRFLILTHRYLGTALGVLFVMWFATGIAMMYARNMPRLTPELRLERLDPVDLSAVALGVAEAAGRANLTRPATRVSLTTVLGRPAYRFGASTTVFADTGERLWTISASQAREVASRFAGVPASRIVHVATLTEPDQWTLQQRQSPLYKFAIDDDARTELYVSGPTAEVVMMTTRGSRMLAWLGAIPHWMYFSALRTHQELWRQVVLWTSGIGIALALLGIWLGIVQLRVARAPLRLRVPYSGWMRWHHVGGLVFGVFTLTFVFSGWLSMEPFGWAAYTGRAGAAVREAFSTRPARLDDFPRFDAPLWRDLHAARPIKEIEYIRIAGEPYFMVRRTPTADTGIETRGHQPYFADRSRDGALVLVSARTLDVRHAPFAPDELRARVEAAAPDAAIVEAALLSSYDSYYYSRERRAPLPVLRVKLGDPDRTWVYIDPSTSQLVASIHRLDRVERWIYNGFHSLDFAFWYDRRPLWDIVMIVLNVGGLAVSLIGLCFGVKRIGRSARRAFGSAPAFPERPSHSSTAAARMRSGPEEGQQPAG